MKCGPTYLASGSVHGLSAATSVGLSLTSEVGVEMLTVESGGAATAFAFTKRLPSMSTYALAVTAYATSLMNGGMSLMGVMKLLGHRDYRMTISG